MRELQRLWVGVVIRSNGGGAGANRNSLIVFQFATIDGSRAQSRLPVCRPSCWESNFSLGQPRTPANVKFCLPFMRIVPWKKMISFQQLYLI